MCKSITIQGNQYFDVYEINIHLKIYVFDLRGKVTTVIVCFILSLKYTLIKNHFYNAPSKINLRLQSKREQKD